MSEVKLIIMIAASAVLTAVVYLIPCIEYNLFAGESHWYVLGLVLIPLAHLVLIPIILVKENDFKNQLMKKHTCDEEDTEVDEIGNK